MATIPGFAEVVTDGKHVVFRHDKGAVGSKILIDRSIKIVDLIVDVELTILDFDSAPRKGCNSLDVDSLGEFRVLEHDQVKHSDTAAIEGRLVNQEPITWT